MTTYFEIHLHADTQQVRVYQLQKDERPLRFHAGFSQADIDAGWTQTRAFGAEGLTDSAIEREKAEVLDGHKAYWLDLAQLDDSRRVVEQGHHYFMHELGEGIGFGGRAFRVVWLDQSRSVALCNLSSQGPVPAWMRDRLPDNAASVSEER